jgi:uncharacterized repeat protein (TIGR04138 family)
MQKWDDFFPRDAGILAATWGSCYIGGMPPNDSIEPADLLAELVEQMDRYPADAFHFLQQGLSYTVEKLHASQTDPDASRHVSGKELSEGLREFALMRWGMLARTVLGRWNIHSTIDFGRIVFGMVEKGILKATEDDSIDDFRDVFDFKIAFDRDYRIAPLVPAPASTTEGRL